MAKQTLEKEPPERSEEEAREITFKCKYCGQDKPLGDMRRIDRFFPAVIACSDCERKLG